MPLTRHTGNVNLRVGMNCSAQFSEWPTLSRSLGFGLLSHLLGVSHSSVRHYAADSRTSPDRVATRLHFLALVVGDLAGAYNEIGIRRWFDRPRTQLGGKSPAQVLAGDWSPEDEAAARVRELAGTLGFSPATGSLSGPGRGP